MNAKNPVQARGIEKKALILAAARKLFEEKGYHGTNSKEIASRAGVSTGSFYRYYNDKKCLFLEVIGDFYKEVAETAVASCGALLDASSKDSLDPRLSVHALIRALRAAHGISPALSREISAAAKVEGDIEEAIRLEEGKIGEFVRALLLTAKDRLRVKDIDAASFVVRRAAEEIIHELMSLSRGDEERILSELEDMIAIYLFG